MSLRSKQFDDVYFSKEDGLAETRHVFLEGNGLPDAWVDKEKFVIAETGFGTGLNFLAAWQLFEETAREDQELHFYSVEKYPLDHSVAVDALKDWNLPALPDIQYGLQHYVTDRVTLEVRQGDANDVLPRMTIAADAWFLDGFKPSSNPEMWTDTIFENIARMTKEGGSFATFTAAGFVRRGLEEVGFEVRKTPGFGTKRDMLVGRKPCA